MSRTTKVVGAWLYEDAIERIRQLEAEIARMKPVVDVALTWNRTNYRDLKECELALDAIGNACDDYEQASQPK